MGRILNLPVSVDTEEMGLGREMGGILEVVTEEIGLGREMGGILDSLVAVDTEEMGLGREIGGILDSLETAEAVLVGRFAILDLSTQPMYMLPLMRRPEVEPSTSWFKEILMGTDGKQTSSWVSLVAVLVYASLP